MVELVVGRDAALRVGERVVSRFRAKWAMLKRDVAELVAADHTVEELDHRERAAGTN